MIESVVLYLLVLISFVMYNYVLSDCLFVCLALNPLTAKLFNWNFHPLEVVSRWRDPQL